MPVRHACAIQSLVTDAKNAECWLLQDSNHLSPDAFKPRSSADGDWDASLSILFPPAGQATPHKLRDVKIAVEKKADVSTRLRRVKEGTTYHRLSTAAFEYCVRCDYHL